VVAHGVMSGYFRITHTDTTSCHNPRRTQRATFPALRSRLTHAPCGNARRQVISPPPLDDSSAQGPSLLPGPRTPVARSDSLETAPRFTVYSVFSSGHTPGKSAAFRRGAKLAPLSVPLPDGLRFLPVLYLLRHPPHLRLGDSVRVTDRERIRLTTVRRLYQQTGLGRLCTPGKTARAAGDR